MTDLQNKSRFKKKDLKLAPIYSRCLLTRSVSLPISSVGKNLTEILEKKIISMIEGRCLVQGFVKPKSTKIITHSSGVVQGSSIVFEVTIDCEVCFPVEGMLISCVAKNITKAGIRAESSDDVPSPVVVFVARDHHYSSTQFSNIQEGDKFTVRVIGQRFELNDKYISIIAELVSDEKNKEKPKVVKKKPKLIIQA
jgi:DNA-directed RNA polymerase subunit E'/Rpb7